MNDSTAALVTPLRVNAVFSLLTGLLLVAAPSTVGEWLGVSVDGWLRLLGIALVSHAAILGWATRQPSLKSWASLNLMAIAPYPIVMVGLVVFGLIDSGTGQLLVLADGLVVAIIAGLHWMGLRNHAAALHPRNA